MQLNQLQRPEGMKRSQQRVGRGQSSGRGKTAGRGTKGQNARSGRKKRPELRDIIKKIPKRRGFGKNRGRTVVSDRPRPIVVTLERLQEMYSAGTEVTPQTVAASLNIRTKLPVKIIGGGKFDTKLTVKGCATSASAKVAIEKAGGTVTV